MSRYGIYNATHTWSNCPDTRPWLLLDHPNGPLVDAFPISSQCYRGNCFWLDPSRTDFAATGLNKGCFVHYASIIALPIANLGRHRGVLTGMLLAEFLDESGI